MWTIGAVFAIFRYFKAPSGLDARRRLALAGMPLGCFVLGYILWILGMGMA
jgi:hypothetical protein